MSEAWYVRTIEIKFLTTNRTEYSSYINISEFSTFNPTLIELAHRMTYM